MSVEENAEFVFDPDSEFTPASWMGRLSRAYERSYKRGRGIKRLTCFLVGFVPYWAAIFTLCVVSLLVFFGYWLVLPKDEYEERFGDL